MGTLVEALRYTNSQLPTQYKSISQKKKKSESPIRQLPSQYKSNFKKKEKRIRWIDLILYLSGAYKFKSNIENSIVER